MAIITMDTAIELGSLHVAGAGEMMLTGNGSNYQFRNVVGSELRVARFDVNPNWGDGATKGPHLNLDTFVRNKYGRWNLVQPNTHIQVDPLTVRPGDFP